MRRSEIIHRLLASAAVHDALGPTSEGDLLRSAAAMLLEQEIKHHRKAMQEYLERLDNGVRPALSEKTVTPSIVRFLPAMR